MGAFNFKASLVLIIVLLLCNDRAIAQLDSSESSKTTIGISAYLDVFYTYDFNKPTNGYRLPYIVNHNRHNEFNLNMGYLGAYVDNDRYRAKLLLQAGTYANDNYSDEDALLRIINEASAGIALTKNRKLWLDAGILSSNIGFEPLFQIDGLNLTRSIMVESVPYYLTGAKLSYTFNSKWSLMVMATNGWQRIKRVEGNSLMSFSTQLLYNPSEKVNFGVNTFIGTDDPDTTRRMRYFIDLYSLFILNDKWTFHGGMDYGMQQKSKGSSDYDRWLMYSLMARYSISQKWLLGLRSEYINDVNNVIIDNPSPNEFISYGGSANIDYRPVKNVMARVEARYLFGKNDIFIKGDEFVNNDLFITFSIVVKFDKAFKL